MLTQNFACSESVPGVNTFLPETIMKVYLILGLLATAAYAEKKINLEDIERDNLRAENKGKVETVRTDETKYAVKSNVNQQQYQIPNQYNILGGHSDAYISPQQLQDVKYSQAPPEAYVQPNQYAIHDTQYRQPNQILLQQNIPPLQYYNGYQQQAEAPAQTAASVAFESQKLNYQPEIVVGNHIQSVQQKAITEKYTKTLNKEPVYLDPAAQLLSYYPYLNINSLGTLKSTRLAQPSLQQLASSTTQQISIPLYTPVYNQKQLVSSVKVPYSTIVPAALTTKVTKGPVALPVTSKNIHASSATQLTTPLYVSPQQSYVQGKTLLHTQAYIQPQLSQAQYVQPLVYAQPGIIYSDPTAAYSDLYTRVPVQYIQDNSLRGQANQYQTQQQLYVTQQSAQQAPKEIVQEQLSQDLLQNYDQLPGEPKTHFVPPQLPPQDFKSGITQLQPISYEAEQSLPVQDHSLPSEPRSLLDSYIPSNVIAAQDSARYRERPIKLEGGFLPSKANFALKKRKSE